MVKLSININKIATLRNSRGMDVPSLSEVVDICVRSGCHGITVHPRSDQRHIRFDDIPALKRSLQQTSLEFNIECDPTDPALMELVFANKPTQCTLVPVQTNEVTSTDGFDLDRSAGILKPLIERLKKNGIRTSLFSRTDLHQMELAKEIGVDCVELNTINYYRKLADPVARAAEFERLRAAAELASDLGLRVHCGHDITLKILRDLIALPGLCEVSIGHHLISDSLFVGLPSVLKEHLAIIGDS